MLTVTTTDGTSSSAFTSQVSVLSVTDTVYDSAGRVTDSDGPHAVGATASGTHTTYDANGQATSTEQVDGLEITLAPVLNTQDQANTAVTSAGTVVSTTTSTYDAAGRVTSSTFTTPGPNGLDRATSTVYDGDGRAVKAIGPDGQSTQTVYDADGRKAATCSTPGRSPSPTGAPARPDGRYASARPDDMKAIIRDRLRRRLSAPRRVDCTYRLAAFSTAPGFDATAWLPGDTMARFFESTRPDESPMPSKSSLDVLMLFPAEDTLIPSWE